MGSAPRRSRPLSQLNRMNEQQTPSPTDANRNAPLITALFADLASAEQTVADLRRAGIPAEQIGLLVRDSEGVVRETGGTGAERAGTGAAIGAAGGGVVGAIGGWMIGVGALVLPGIGPVIAGGFVATALGTAVAGAAAGAAAGGVAGMLISLGIPRDEARDLESEVRQGHVLLTVRTLEPRETLEIIERHGGRTRAQGGSAPTEDSGRKAKGPPGTAPLSGHLPGSFGAYPVKRNRP